MNRPLVISDCDEVLLHMVRHFRDWLDREHDIEFRLVGNNFSKAMKRRNDPRDLSEAEMWVLLGGFFDTEMPAQTAIPGAVEAVAELQHDADVVILTNLNDARADARTSQLRALGINARVFTNQGPKGPALKAIIDEYAPSRAMFIDDIAGHHRSAANDVPQARRLHFCGEPTIAPHIECAHQAGHAHRRIDRWDEALPWIQSELFGEN